MTDINYSIIIPHHNIPCLLDRCLCSIPQRPDVQVIVVDDASSEEFQQAINSLCIKYPWVEFYSCDKNLGGGHARNVGVDKAKGKYLIFADADDMFTFCLSDMMDFYKDKTYDIIFFNATSLITNLYTNTKRMPMVKSIFELWDSNPSKAEFLFRYKAGEPWSRFVNRNFVCEHNISFEETMIHNDTQFAYLCGFYAQSLNIDPHSIYFLMDRENSVSKTITADRLLTRVQVFCKKNAFLRDHGVSFFEESFIGKSLYIATKKGDDNLLDKMYSIGIQYGISRQQMNHALNKEIYRIRKNRLKKIIKKILKIK